MKPAILGTLIGTAFGAMLWSCSVHRVSDNFKCDTNADCPADRVCTQGFCVLGQNPLVDALQLPDAPLVCPAICDGSCDFQTRTCTIVGTGGADITCPTGWNCNIRCEASGACGAISCTAALSCDVDCTADSACLGITCNTKDCDVTCAGVAACGDVRCTSGDCTVDCSGGNGSAACGTISCSTGDCDASCAGSNACGAITCSTGRCHADCSGGVEACGTLTCGTGECQATCTGGGLGSSACGNVDCESSCKCDVACNGLTDPCPATMLCPDRAPGAAYCTANGSNGQRCSSSFASQCDNC